MHYERRISNYALNRMHVICFCRVLYFSASILGPVSLGKRWGSLNCPKVCSKDADPVCGSDRVIYTNDCELRKFTCKKSKFILMSTVYWHSSVVLHVSRLCFGSSRSDQGGLKPLYRSDERCQLHTQMYEKHRSGLWNKRKNIPQQMLSSGWILRVSTHGFVARQ